jgi:hypothetical protein
MVAGTENSVGNNVTNCQLSKKSSPPQHNKGIVNFTNLKMTAGILCRSVRLKLTDVSDVLTALMMKAVSTTDMLVNFYPTT